jgi:sigma-B regulation protein RsbU (phosphoserine phosphatase)
MWMTFFVGRYDKRTGVLTYSSASHNSPFVFPNKEDLKKSDIVTLMDNVGPSLGRQAEAEYTESDVQIEVGDLMFFYTDGLPECTNAKKELLGESKVIRSLVKSWNGNKTTESFIHTANQSIEKFREGHPLEDDVTFFAVRRIN